MGGIAETPVPPYYAVVFTSQSSDEQGGYAATSERMIELARNQPGFIGIESARGGDGFGITVSYWESEAAIAAWKEDADHRAAQAAGVKTWYADYQLRVAKVERAYRKQPGATSQP